MLRTIKPVVDVEYRRDSGRSPMNAVLDALSTAAGTDPVTLPTLYEAVDPDVIETLVDHEESEAAEGLLHFSIDRWTVFLRSDGSIRVCDRTESVTPEPVFAGHPAR